MKKIVSLFVVVVVFSIFPAKNLSAQNKDITVLITGANRGLGLEMAKQFTDDGYTVIGTARKPERAKELNDLGVKVVALDVTDSESIQAMVTSLDGVTIDILINNAGYFGPNKVGTPLNDLEKLTKKEIEDCFSVNSLGPIFVTKALLPNLKKSKIKKLIYISSRASILNRTKQKANYGYKMSKVALNMGVLIMHNDLKKEGFIVTAIAPGHTQTDMGGKGAQLTPEQTINKVKTLITSLTTKQSGKLLFNDGSVLEW
ncbi:SDR family oxidoreductase [Polaribacter sp.]|nr:SDR family oxidoreductase [Polaribacter sp.]